MNLDPNEFAQDWIESWNSHDLPRILSHYADTFSITTPMIKMALGVDTGTLCGKQAVGNYWRQALEKIPDLQFELLDVLSGVNSVAVYYRSVLNKLAIEVMFFNDDNKVADVVVHYSS